MKPRPLSSADHPGVASDDGDRPVDLPRCGPLPERLGAAGPGSEEPLAVVAAGPAGAGRNEVLAALLGQPAGMLAVTAGACLVVRHAPQATRAAYVPGYRQPLGYGADQLAAGPALARPPRRVELSLPVPLLRHFTLVDTPDSGTLGMAGGRLLLDAAGRAGALLFVIAADQAFTAAELDLLAELGSSTVEVFFVVTPGVAGWEPGPGGAATGDTGASVPPTVRSGIPEDAVALSAAAHRAALLAAVPTLARAPWFPARSPVLPELQRALVGWAADEGLRRASAEPPVPPGTHERVAVAPAAARGDWADRLDRQARACAQRIRQDLALELAKIHLRVVQEIVFGVGSAGLPQLLDREMEALSALATAQCDQAVRRLLHDASTRVLGAPPAEGVRRRIAGAVRWGLAEHAAGRELDRVLLVTSTAGVADLAGAGAIDALAGYPGAERTEVLPPLAVALSGGCWQHWRSPGNDDPAGARSWAQRALREVELELTREVSRRFEVIRLSIFTVLTDAVDHGILLA
ncbi:hypothetical protein K7640_11225 [Micromonospora sp. PLK6-60]|uniref:hypothetical protein n=1 Tax=Micromonospora sp. PLK6-60 TaxID=2873383 RepID=UPI001CA661EE|nr:hypothetical protein [Micromonospora sp. PLK6-60]MBY8872411.1 hypothetical protein [Micromonospora sp. PLK6-60]